MDPDTVHGKKGSRFFRPQTGCHLPNFPWPEKIYLFPARESWVSDIPAEDGKISNLFLQCGSVIKWPPGSVPFMKHSKKLL